jgi:hypothetical protein
MLMNPKFNYELPYSKLKAIRSLPDIKLQLSNGNRYQGQYKDNEKDRKLSTSELLHGSLSLKCLIEFRGCFITTLKDDVWRILMYDVSQSLFKVQLKVTSADEFTCVKPTALNPSAELKHTSANSISVGNENYTKKRTAPICR